MTTDDTSYQPGQQEILPAVSSSVSAAPETWQLPQGLFGSALFARYRYESEQRQFEAYTRLVAAKNALVRVLCEQQELIAIYMALVERTEDLDTVRLIARKQVQNELMAIENQGKLNQLAFETEMARGEFERDRFRAMRAELTAPKTPVLAPAPVPTTAENFRVVAEEMDAVERVYREIREEIIARAGGDEENIPEEVRAALGNFEMMRDSAIQEAMSKLL